MYELKLCMELKAHRNSKLPKLKKLLRDSEIFSSRTDLTPRASFKTGTDINILKSLQNNSDKF